MSNNTSLSEQAEFFSALSSPLRLHLLEELADGPVTAPDLHSKQEYDVTAETLHNNLSRLREVGLIKSEKVYGSGNRPKDRFMLSENGFEIHLSVTDDYEFSTDGIE